MRTLLLLAALASSVSAFAEMRLELVRQSLTGAHCRYREYVDGIPSDTYEMRPCGPAAHGVATEARPMEPDQPLRIVDGRVVRRVIVAERPLEPYAYDYDVATGALIRSVPLFFHAKPARVFDSNPVVTLNDTALQDRNDSAAAVPEQAYRTVELQDVAPAGPLAGPNVKLVDRQSPNVAPPDGSSSLLFDRAADGFEDVNVYFHVDRTQRYLQSLGYTGARAIAAYAIEADAHSAGGADNSFFLPSATRFAEGTLHFGEGGTDDAEDADLIVHEYGHAIQEWISPGTFGGAFTSESRALSEGFGDYWAYSAHVAQRIAFGRDPFCFADWDARCWEDDASQQCGYRPGSDCLRRLDGTRTMADYERVGGGGVEHRNGSIWSSALREIHQQLGRTVTDTIVLEAMFDVPPQPTYAVMARRIIEADRLLFNASHASVICASMMVRGILAGCDDTRPRGEQTFFQSNDRALAIPENNSAGLTTQLTISDTRAIERIFVRVDIAHPLRGDLRIDLIAPDGTTVILQQASLERGSGIHTTYGLTAQPAEPLDVLQGRSAAGVWKLVVRDLRSLDAGTLLSWGLILQLAGDVPLSVRPRGEHAQMIPVVAHVFGVDAAPFASDVRLANPGTERVTATMIFTPSGQDGRTQFAAIDAVLEPGQTIAFDDVVDSAFHTAGSGSLEILGNVVAMSRTYAENAQGTLGEQVPRVAATTALGELPLGLAVLPQVRGRYNIGLTETAGTGGTVQVGDVQFDVQPFSHLQFAAGDRFPLVRVVAGQARVAAYVSEVNETGDAMFIPAEPMQTQSVERIAPGISAGPWRTDLWFRGDDTLRILNDALRTTLGLTFGLLRVTLPPGELAGTLISNGGTGQFVPLVSPDGTTLQQLLFVETMPPYRTNIGIFSAAGATAEVVVYDAGGAEVQRAVLQTANGVAQMAVLPRIAGGRAVVRFFSGRGYAYASLVDSRTGDGTYVNGQ